MSRFIAVAFAVVALSTPALADIAEGRALAMQWCSSCHVVANQQAQPAVDGAPSFRSLANDTSVTEFRLRMFMQTPHPVMPNFMLSRQQTDDLVGYIQSLKDR